MKTQISYESIETLLVEDNLGDAELATIALKRSQFVHHLSVARNGIEALAMLRSQAPFGNAPLPTLILLDLNLPKKHGLDVLADIKADPLLRQIRVVVFTSSSSDEDITIAHELGADEYVAKPLDLGEYFAAVNSIGQRHLEAISKWATVDGSHATSLPSDAPGDPCARTIMRLLLKHKLI